MSTAVDFTRAEERIRRDFLASGVSSLALAVAQHGKILWEAAFGRADVERRIPATPDTMFSVASTTKPFTATALMILAERGRIDLDRPVNDYLPADSQLKVWIGDPAEVTVRRLFTHTAGLPGQFHIFNADERHLKPSFEESIRRYGNIITLPGERFRYSNFGYGIMDYLVEQLSGMEFGAFLHQEIFEPLGMTRCSLDIAPGLEPYAAERYDDNGRPIPFYDVDHRGASSIYCSPHDLIAFGNFHLGQRPPGLPEILSRAAIEAMQAPSADRWNLRSTESRWPPASGASPGWAVAETPWGPLVSSAGGMPGASAQLAILPSEGIVMAAAANGGCEIPRTIDKYLLPSFLAGYPEDANWHQTQSRTPHPPDPASPAYQALCGEWHGQMRTWEGDFPFCLHFLASGEIHAQLGQQQVTLVNHAELIDGWLTGQFAGSPETSDALRRPRHPLHHLQLDLKHRAGRITGALGQSAGNTLAHWVELDKTN